MNPKLRILCTGEKTLVELNGKTICRGIEAITFSHDTDNQDDPKIGLRIDLDAFEFMPDGYFDLAARDWQKKTRPKILSTDGCELPLGFSITRFG